MRLGGIFGLLAAVALLVPVPAAADGTPGAEGLSGLARAFFSAGARSLLVSHWSVDREAAIALTRALFRTQGAPGGKAAALREAMRAMIEGRTDGEALSEFAHPAYWAPFVVVGEGA